MRTFITIILAALSLSAIGRQSIQGPTIEEFGETFTIEEPDFKIDPDRKIDTFVENGPFVYDLQPTDNQFYMK